MSKNVLFIGPYKQDDVWGENSRNYILALAETNYNIATRYAKLGVTSNSISIDNRILSLEENKYDKWHPYSGGFSYQEHLETLRELTRTSGNLIEIDIKEINK